MKEGSSHSRWCGYDPGTAPGFTPGADATLWWARMHEIPYDQRRLSRKRRGGSASGWLWPDCTEEFYLSLRGIWFKDGLPKEGTPFLVWTWQKGEKDYVVAVPTHEWTGKKWERVLKRRRVRKPKNENGTI